MKVDLLKGTVLIDHVLDTLKGLLVHAGVGDEQDPPVDVPGVLEGLPDILLRRVGEAAHHHAAHHHLALAQDQHRVEQQRVAEDLDPLRDPSGLAHHVGAVDDKGGGDEALHPFHRLHDLPLGGVVLRHVGRA